MAEYEMLRSSLVYMQVVAYILAIVFGLCTCVPTMIHLHDFNNHCLLFTNGTWNPPDGQLIAQWGSQAYCDYNVIWSLLSILIAVVQLLRILRNWCMDEESSFFGVSVEFFLSLIICLAALVGGLITSLGYQSWCNTITGRFLNCEDAASASADIDKKDEINTANFYVHFVLIQFGSWSCWACWTALSLCAILLVCSLHQDYVIRVSMARERARLVGDRDSRRSIMT